MRKHLKALPRSSLLIILSAIFQFGIVLYFRSNFDPAIARLIPDDTFYYLQIARNIANGLGSVFSAGEPTNGYHPLWIVLLVLLHFLVPGTYDFVLAVLVLSVVCNVGAAIVLCRLLQNLRYSQAEVELAIGLFLLSPWFVNLTLTGMETPLFLLFLFAFFLSVRRLNHPAARVHNWIVFGLCSGLVMLARTDAVFFVATAMIYFAIRKCRTSLVQLGVAGAVAMLVVAPWLLWNYTNFGTIQQSSAGAMSALLHYGNEESYDWLHNPLGSLEFVIAAWIGLAFRLFISPFAGYTDYAAWTTDMWTVAASLFLAILLVTALLFAAARKDIGDRALAAFPFLIWGLPAILLVGFYTLVRWFWQPWNMIPLLVLLLLLVPLTIPPRIYKGLGHAVPSMIMIILTLYSLQFCYFYPQMGILSNAIHYQEQSPQPLKIGATDAGYLGYFSRHIVVNLDGVVNDRAYRAIMAGRFSHYVQAQDFDIVLVNPRRLGFYDRNRSGSADILLRRDY